MFTKRKREECQNSDFEMVENFGKSRFSLIEPRKDPTRNEAAGGFSHNKESSPAEPATANNFKDQFECLKREEEEKKKGGST